MHFASLYHLIRKVIVRSWMTSTWQNPRVSSQLSAHSTGSSTSLVDYFLAQDTAFQESTLSFSLPPCLPSSSTHYWRDPGPNIKPVLFSTHTHSLRSSISNKWIDSQVIAKCPVQIMYKYLLNISPLMSNIDLKLNMPQYNCVPFPTYHLFP